MLNIQELNDRVNLTLTREDLLLFAEAVIQKYTEQNLDAKFPERMTISQIARYLNYSTAAIYKLVGQAEIPSYKLSGKLLFKKSEIDDWMQEFKQPTIKASIAELNRKCK